MAPNFVHVLLVGVSFALLSQVDRVITLDCGTVNFVRPVILGGSPAIKGEWPFIVAIENRSKYICGGTIISNRHILTAAHCIQKKWSEEIVSPHDVVVRLGSYNLTKDNEKGAIRRNVSDICMHDEWDAFENSFDADIAILVLSENITFTDDIQPVCMPANHVAENMEGSVVGYGVRKKRIFAENPRRIVVRAVESSHCWRKDDVVRSYSSGRTFCGENGDGSPDIGDSGSGYFFTPGFSWAQYGIVSVLRTNNTGHVDPYIYHVYTNVTIFKDWIIKKVNETGGEVGEARIVMNMNCDYGYSEVSTSFDSVYSCRLYNIDIPGSNFEIGSFDGSHLYGKTRKDVEEIHFVNGTMSHLPSGFGLFFENIKHLLVLGTTESLGTKVIRRSDLRHLKKLEKLSVHRNDIETLHENALWDLPNLQMIKFVENKLKVLGNETFSKNRRLMMVHFYSNELTFLPANLFRNNLGLMEVQFQNNFLKAIDETFFKTNRQLRSLSFSSNQLTSLPRRLFQYKSSLQLVMFDENALSSIDEDLFETNVQLIGVSFHSNRIKSLPRTLFRNNFRLLSASFKNNSITTIDENLFTNNPKLKVVFFSMNRLERLHRNVFKNNSQLEVLNLSENRLKIIDMDLAAFERVNAINLRLNDCVNEEYLRQDDNNSGLRPDSSGLSQDFNRKTEVWRSKFNVSSNYYTFMLEFLSKNNYKAQDLILDENVQKHFLTEILKNKSILEEAKKINEMFSNTDRAAYQREIINYYNMTKNEKVWNLVAFQNFVTEKCSNGGVISRFVSLGWAYILVLSIATFTLTF